MNEKQKQIGALETKIRHLRAVVARHASEIAGFQTKVESLLFASAEQAC
jgi:hypothetical protein